MTNAQIIAEYCEAMEINPVTFHTFEAWKKMGFSVKKGEHSKHLLMIWKPRKHKATEEQEQDGTQIIPKDFFMTKEHFFTIDQVELIEK